MSVLHPQRNRVKPLSEAEHWLYLGIIAGLRLAQLALIGVAIWVLAGWL